MKKQSLKKQPSPTREQLNKSPTLPEKMYPADALANKRHEFGVQAVEVATSKGTNNHHNGTNKNEFKVCKSVEFTVDQTRGLTP